MPITQKNSLGINFPITHTHTSVTQKNCFRTICVIISGLIVSKIAHFNKKTDSKGRGCDIADHLQGSFGTFFFLEGPKTVCKDFWGPKSQKTVENRLFLEFLSGFRLRCRLFSDILGPRGPKNRFQDFCRSAGQRSDGQRYCKAVVVNDCPMQ